MKFSRLLAAAAALALALPACADSAAVSAPPAAAPSGPALWKVADDDTTIYLFGTIHALRPDIQWYDGRIAAAFASSGELVTEIDPEQVAGAERVALELGLLPPGQSLRALMTPGNRAEYEAALASLGLEANTLDRFEPWLATITLVRLQMEKQGYGPESGAEGAFVARAAGKAHRGLESAAFQLGLFDAIPPEQQLKYLDETVAGLPRFDAELGAMVADWLAGDADALALLLNEEMAGSELYDRLLIDRNVDWAAWIGRRLGQPGTVFVAVGAGHLAGKGSVQEQLASRGVSVSRVN